MINTYEIFVGNPEGKRLLTRLKFVLEVNTEWKTEENDLKRWTGYSLRVNMDVSFRFPFETGNFKDFVPWA